MTSLSVVEYMGERCVFKIPYLGDGSWKCVDGITILAIATILVSAILMLYFISRVKSKSGAK